MQRFLYCLNRLFSINKIIIAKILVLVWYKRLERENIWLFEEKHTEARDNAYHLYRYVKEHHPEINAFYVITKNAADEKKIADYGTTIYAETIKHYVYWIVSKYNIGSQPYGAAPMPKEKTNKYKWICRKDQKTIFLQHGIINNDLPGLDYSRTGFDLFVCSAIPELKYVRDGLHYPEEHAQLLGLCRFDELWKFQTKRVILIMPTFRKWLVSAHTDRDATESEMNSFMESDYYQHYFELLTNKTILECAEKEGYKIVFYLHYALQSYTKAFASCSNNLVTIADRNCYDVQQLLMDSAVLITDYSSIFFDFAYMGKPEIYYQFDEPQYRKGHYGKGYFDCYRDGFGPVFTKSNELVQYLSKLLTDGCINAVDYLERIQSFFPQRDSNNCQRNFDAIINLK